MERYFWERYPAALLIFDRTVGVARPGQQIALAYDVVTADIIVTALNAKVSK